MSKMNKDLKDLRSQIDVLDHQLLKLLRRRFALVKKVGKLKLKYDLPIYQRARWLSMLSQYVVLGEKLDLESSFVESLMKLVHRQSIKIQKSMKKVKA